MQRATPQATERPESAHVAAVITICAQQKRTRITAAGTPAALEIQPQKALEIAWRHAVAALPVGLRVRDLYAGRAFGLAKSAATRTASPLYVISAGLGLVPGDILAPAYGLTIARNVPESIANRADGPFDPVGWFASLLVGSCSVGWDRLEQEGPGRILVALTKPYAEMVGPSLAAAPPRMLERVRIFGANLSRALPGELHSAVMPYDERLDVLLPGTRSDFAQRALFHFVEKVAAQAADQAADGEIVRSLLATISSPKRVVRPRRSDADLLQLIESRLRPRASASALLRQLRDEDGIACEQGRFARLFRTAVGGGSEA